MILIDGKECADGQLDPAKHRFLGMFRHPFPGKRPESHVCRVCGRFLLHYSHDPGAKCWQEGHFDLPQYQTISESP